MNLTEQLAVARQEADNAFFAMQQAERDLRDATEIYQNTIAKVYNLREEIKKEQNANL